MGESEWLSTTDTFRMMTQLQGVSPRKLRLFVCARARQFWHLLADERSRAAIEVGEQFADGRANAEQLEAALAAAFAAAERGPCRDRPSAWVAPGAAVLEVGDPTGDGFWSVAWDYRAGSPPEEATALTAAAELEASRLRDIVGNPFRPVAFAPSWRTEMAIALAAGIYADRAFDRMPILADALEDAGCDHADILNHCRGDGPHARGCWVLDKILGKE